MAKKSGSSRSNAYGSPSSLTVLLSPPSSPLASGVGARGRGPSISPAKNYGGLNGDRRRYHPSHQLRPADALIRDAARLVIGYDRPRLLPRLPSTVHFKIPNLVDICIRRKARREVLHALGLTRKSGKGGGKRRRNFYSQIGC